jgi:hypothetical protein
MRIIIWNGLVMLTPLISHPITTFLLANQLSWNNVKPSIIDILFIGNLVCIDVFQTTRQTIYMLSPQNKTIHQKNNSITFFKIVSQC